MLLPSSISAGWADPFRELRRIQDEMNRVFGGFHAVAAGEFPPINLWTGEDGVVVTAEVPGVRPQDIEITVQQNALTLKGKREPETAEPEVVFHRRERAYGSFARTVALPFNVDSDKVQASFSDGILMVRLPRPAAEKPRRIQIAKA